jgi:hypothetical protein
MRLIDADAVRKQIDEKRPGRAYEDAWALTVLDNAPTVDAVPVCRCKDCKHRDPEDHKCDCGHDILWQLPRDDDWFCADGERKERDV